jgi:ParB/RepB/Spo0J family partition protein
MSQSQSEENIVLVSLDQIVPLPGNVSVLDPEADLMLKNDMTRVETKGWYKIDPILLRPLTAEEIAKIKEKQPWSNPKYQIIDGHKRYSAAVDLGWTKIRAIIKDVSLEEARAINYMKNRARGKVDPLREALYFKHLYEDLKMSEEKIAEKFGISQQRVSQILKRAGITPEARKIITTRVVTEDVTGKHLEVLGTTPPEKQADLAKAIVEEKLSYREAEKVKEALEKGLPLEKAIETAKAPETPKTEIEIAEITCPECGLNFRVVHVNGKHKIKGG